MVSQSIGNRRPGVSTVMASVAGGAVPVPARVGGARARRRPGQRALAGQDTTTRQRRRRRIGSSFHGLTVHDVDDEAEPALVWRVAVEDLSESGRRIVSAMSAEVGEHRSVVVAGGWLHNPPVRAVKEQQYGDFVSRDLPEPGATGAARMAGIAPGVLSPPWHDDVGR